MIVSLSVAKLHKIVTQTDKMKLTVSVLAKVMKNEGIMESSCHAWLYGTKCVITLVPTCILFAILLQHSTSSQVWGIKAKASLAEMKALSI